MPCAPAPFIFYGLRGIISAVSFPSLPAGGHGVNFKECVRRFCVEKLARILYDCVASSAGNRALLDWFTAERFVLANGHITDLVTAFYRAELLRISRDAEFASFDRLCGRAVWDSFYQPLRRELRLSFGGGNSPLHPYPFRLIRRKASKKRILGGNVGDFHLKALP